MAAPAVEHWPIPTPFPVGDVNAYYLPGREPALIDPGPRTPEAWARLSDRLRGKRVRRVVFTHYHVDHAGLAHRLQEEHGVEVAAHHLDGSVLVHWGEHRAQRERDYGEGLLRAGVPLEHREQMRYGGTKIEALSDSCRLDHPLEDGDRIMLGDAEYEVLHTPGHTAGSMLLRAPGREHTFSGDTLLATITPNALSVRQSERGALPDYLATLRRLETERLGRVLPGHRDSFDDVDDVIGRALRHAEVRQARVLRLLQDKEGTAFDVAERLFLRIGEDQRFLAVSETLGHLEFLLRSGSVRVDRQRDVDVYAAAKA